MWKSVKDYENLYEVSSEGEVRSLDRFTKTNKGYRTYKGKLLKKNIGTNGYYYVILSKNGVCKTKYIHRLVCETFIENTYGLSDVDHINENKLDNRLINLRFISHFDNASRSNKGKDRYDKHLEHNPKTKTVIGVKDGVIVENIDCAKKLTIKNKINYSTLRKWLQHNKCIINGVNYFYEENFYKIYGKTI